MIIISQDAVAFAENGGTATISVACPSDWTGECPESWLKLEQSDAAIVITADANVTGKKRTAVVLLKNGADSKEIRVVQAWSNEFVQIYVNSPESVKLDSEGDVFSFAVSSNKEWTIESGDSWISVEGDCAKGLATVTATPNEGSARTSSVTVSASAGGETKSVTINISQISRDENPYFRLTGYYGLYAENWWYNSESLGYSGTAGHCTIEEDVYGKTFKIKNLFRDGTEIIANYDKEKEGLTIDLGARCLELEQENKTYYFFPVAINFAGSSSFSTAMITGIPGKGYSDESENERDAILLSGFPEEYPCFGLVVYTGTGYAVDGGCYYADGKMYFVKADEQ